MQDNSGREEAVVTRDHSFCNQQVQKMRELRGDEHALIVSLQTSKTCEGKKGADNHVKDIFPKDELTPAWLALEIVSLADAEIEKEGNSEMQRPTNHSRT